MGSSGNSKSTDVVPPDFLALIRHSGVLTDRQFEEVQGKVLGGDYPSESHALALRLVEERVLTAFQADRLLRNKPRGLVVGRYVILDRLGEGAKGRVFKAQHQLMGRLVALKVIAPEIASRASSIARFYREIRLIGRLDHPNIVRAFDADQVGELLYIVMEYVPGRSLERVLEDRGPLPPADVAGYLAQTALGLGHAHDQGIVHRDVKPANLLLSDVGQVKVLDLGLSALMEADSKASFATAAGLAVGTVDYMSPEQASGRDLDGRSDLFSLGCTMYFLLTGQLPYEGETIVERMTQRVRGYPIPIADLRPDLPPRLVHVLDKLLARRPEDRFQTAIEAAEALQSLAHGKVNTYRFGRRASRPTLQSSSSTRSGSPGLASTVDSHSTPAGNPPGRSPSFGSRLASLLTAKSRGILLWVLLAAPVVFGIGFALGYVSAVLTGSGGK